MHSAIRGCGKPGAAALVAASVLAVGSTAAAQPDLVVHAHTNQGRTSNPSLGPNAHRALPVPDIHSPARLHDPARAYQPDLVELPGGNGPGVVPSPSTALPLLGGGLLLLRRRRREG